jgi:hypothetical protein
MKYRMKRSQRSVLALEFQTDFMKFFQEFFHGLLDVFYAHVFGDHFIILCEYESDFALFFVDENLKKVGQFPRVCNKEAFVYAFKNVKVTFAVGNLSFDVSDNRFPESF